MTDATLPASRYAAGEFRVGQVISKAWSVFSRNFLTFMLVTGIASLPPILLQRPVSVAPVDPLQNLGTTLLVGFLAIVLTYFATAIVVFGAFEVMRGRPVNLGESAKVALRRFFPLIGLAIVMPVLIYLGAILLIVPGVILYTMWFVATPVCVVERVSVFRSMGRSRQLTKGNRWRILGLSLVVFIPALIIGAIVAAVAFQGGFAALSSALGSTVGKIANLIWSAFWTAFYAIMVVVAYHDLRVAKEGVDTEQIAAVFD
jgi:hypothetical protein